MKKNSVYFEIFTHTGIYSIAIIAGKMASFALLPVYTRFLTPSDYGVMELLDLTSFILSAMVGMRIGDSLFYYYAKAVTEGEKRVTVCTLVAGSLLLGGVGGAIGWFGAPYLSRIVFGKPEFAYYFKLVAATFCLSPFVELGFCYMRALNRAATYAVAATARILLTIGFSIVLVVVVRQGVAGVLWASLLSSVCTALFVAVYCLMGVGLRVSFNFRLLKEFIRYAAPLGVSSLGVFIINYGDRFFLQRYVSLADLGRYALAYKLGILITYIQMPFECYWRAQMFSIVNGPNGEKVWVRVCTYLALGLTFMVLLFAVFTRPVLHFMVPKSFWPAEAFVPWIAMAYVIRSVSGQFRYVFLLEGNTVKDFHVITAGSLLCLLCYAVLIPPFGLWGAVASTIVGFTAIFALGLWQAQKTRYFPFEYGRMLRLSVLALAVILGFQLVRPESVWLHAAVGMAFVCGYLVILAALKFLHADEISALGRIAGALKRTPMGPAVTVGERILGWRG